jgi:hypothetical protein
LLHKILHQIPIPGGKLLTVGVGGDRQQSHEAQAASDKCLQNGLETRVAHARKHDSQCENAETFRFNIEHNALLVKTVGAFELSVPAGAGVAMQQTPNQTFQILFKQSKTLPSPKCNARAPLQVLSVVACRFVPVDF